MTYVEVLCNFCDTAAGISFSWSWEGLPGCPQTLRAFWDDTSSVKPPVDFVRIQSDVPHDIPHDLFNGKHDLELLLAFVRAVETGEIEAKYLTKILPV